MTHPNQRPTRPLKRGMIQKHSHDLVKKPLPGMIKKIAVPAAVGFFFHTMFNVVDTLYTGLLSTQALAALSLSFPVFFIIIALGSGLSTGASALCANELGAGNRKKAIEYVHQSLAFGLIASVFLTIIGLLAAPTLFRILGATDAYLADALSYMNIIVLGAALFLLTSISNGLLSSTGDTKTIRNVFIGGFFANIILDPIMMFGLFGFPALGIAGVAIATLVINFFGLIYMLNKISRAGLLCWTCIDKFIPRFRTFRDISVQAFPASLNMLTVAVGIFIITWFISQFGQSAVAAYGIAVRIEQMILIPNIGVNLAALVLVGQNQGARNLSRVLETVKLTHKYGIMLMALGSAILLLAGPTLMQFFTSDPEVIEAGSGYLLIMAFLFHAYLFLFLNVSILQGLKKPMFALYIGTFRQAVIAIPIFWFLAITLGWGLWGVWWGIFVINWISAGITVLYTRRVLSKLNFDKPHKSKEKEEEK